jgi:putative transposase
MIFSFIETEKIQHSIPLMCRVLRVSRSGYYAWRERPPSGRRREDSALAGRIREIHRDSRGTYGAPRVHAKLRSEGARVGNKRVARLMREEGLEGCHRRRRKTPRTTLRDPRAAPAEDLVERDFVPEAANRLWVADISYVPTWEGFDYLAFTLDAYSRRLVGWAMADHLRAELVTDALGMALWRRDPAPGLIHHSDRGSQYTSISFGQKLQEARIIPSMGSVADPYDNALAESFVATLKRELLDRRSWPAREEVRTAMFEYFEVFYNRQRIHSALGYQSPADYEEGRMKVGDAAQRKSVYQTDLTPLRRCGERDWCFSLGTHFCTPLQAARLLFGAGPPEDNSTPPRS